MTKKQLIVFSSIVSSIAILIVGLLFPYFHAVNTIGDFNLIYILNELGDVNSLIPAYSIFAIVILNLIFGLAVLKNTRLRLFTKPKSVSRIFYLLSGLMVIATILLLLFVSSAFNTMPTGTNLEITLTGYVAIALPAINFIVIALAHLKD